jgi:hypothetical protein
VSVAPHELEHFVRVNAAGVVVDAHGSAERLAELSSYVCSLADTVGQLLDIGPCRAVEATYTGGRLITVREPDGSIVGLKPRASVPPPLPSARPGTGRSA